MVTLEADADHGARLVGRIPVRNLWLLVLYASDLRQHGYEAVALEENPDELADVLAGILAHAVEERQRKQLSLGYRRSCARLNRVRGRIDVVDTERHRLLLRGLVACRFDDLTIDTPRNRFVRAALDAIAAVVGDKDLAHRCRKLANDMKLMGVSGAPPTPRQIAGERFARHDADDRRMVDAAKLAFDLAMPTEESGANVLPSPNREEAWIRRLFESGVRGFYDVALAPEGWEVRKRQLRWPMADGTPRIDALLPQMEADIVLVNRQGGRRIVIDTKFAKIVAPGWFREETFKSGYLYQMYAYLRSQADSGEVGADRAEGILLHPAVGEKVDEAVTIQDHRIRFSTVDLAASSRDIRAELLDVVTA